MALHMLRILQRMAFLIRNLNVCFAKFVLKVKNIKILYWASAGGHYFSDLSSYSDGYARKSGSGSTLKMLICLVAMGKMDNAGGIGPAAGYHSFKSGNEFVIYDEKQVRETSTY
jgi:hypothetical protein